MSVLIEERIKSYTQKLQALKGDCQEAIRRKRKRVFMLYVNSEQVDRIETNLNIQPDFAEMKIARTLERNENISECEVWAVIQADGEEKRYHFVNDTFKCYLKFQTSELSLPK